MTTINTIERAGVQVEQIIEPIPGVRINPTLTPVAVGPCYQVVKALDSQGSPVSASSAGSYNNADAVIKSYDFPDPRSNLAYLTFLVDETRAFLQSGADVREVKDDERWLSGNYTTAATSVRAVGVGLLRSPVISITGGLPLPVFTTPSTAAVITGLVDLSAAVPSLVGLGLKFRVDKGSWVSISWTISPASLAALFAEINLAWVAAHNSGAIAAAPGNFLVFTSQTTGETSSIEFDTSASTAYTTLMGAAATPSYGGAHPPVAGDEMYADGQYLGDIVSVDGATQVTLDTEHVVYTGSNPGELDAKRWYIRAKSLTVPAVGDRPTPELYKYPSSTKAVILGIVAIGGTVALLNKTLIFKLDEETGWTTCTFSGTINLATILSEINLAYGAAVAAPSGTSVLISSPTTGNTSRVYIGAGTSNADLGFVTNDSVEGVSTGDLVIEGDFLRDKYSSAVINPALATAYVQYRALRKDVTVLASTPKLARGSDPTTLEADIGPFTTENPLGLSMLAMMTAAPDLYIAGFGVDSVTANEEGDRAAYLRALDFLKAQDVYCPVPLTNQEDVHVDFNLHVEEMSKKENSRFRVTYITPSLPDRKSTTVAATGTDASSTGSNTIQVETDIVSALLATGLVVDPNNPTVAEGVYIMFVGDTKRYNIAAVAGMQCTSNTTFTPGQNTDGFYSASHIPANYLAKSWTLSVRGVAIVALSGNVTDWDTVAETYQLGATNYKNRRTRSVVPNRWSMVDGDSKTITVAGYYASAAAAAQLCYIGPAQGKTNYKLDGFSQIWDANDVFDERNLKVIGYNNYLFVQEPPGEAGIPVKRWHQATTDPTSEDTREESITTQLDWGSIVLKRGLTEFIGVQGLGDNFDDLFLAAFEGLVRFIVGNSAWRGAEVIEYKRKPGSKTGVILRIQPTLTYPCNLADIQIVL